jgi:hypothetical protein
VAVRIGVSVVAIASLLAVAAGCRAESAQPAARPPATLPRVGPLTPTDPDRISPRQAAAIEALASSASPAVPHGDHTGHAVGGPVTTVALDASDAATLAEQWAEAVAVVPGLDSPHEALAAGYTRAAVQGAGVGVHWVNWTLIDAPFDPARPSMLLFDERRGANALVGFSYWIRADAPEGFAGSNDVWHQHTNLCIVNGWVDREAVSSPAACAGDVLAGSDLWMLHAWVVPDRPNPWGDFATLHPALCPPEAGTPDIARCPTDGSDEP